MLTRSTLPLAAIVLSAAGVLGHDLWLVPPTNPKPGEPLTVKAVSGGKFPVGDRAPDPATFAGLLAVGPDGNPCTVAPLGTEGTAGLLRLTPTAAGVYQVAVRTTPKLIVLPADQFNAYLLSDGLPHVYKLRAKEQSLDRPGRERYSKSPKVVVRVGDGGGDPCKPLGLPLEIVPLQDPLGRKPGDTLRVRVLFRERPLKDAYLGWDHPGGGEEPVGTVRTDSRGDALIPVGQSGLMTIRLTHMTRPKAAEYEWESFWTTLTFRVPD